MDWWQGALISLACVVGGLLVGYLLSYLIVTRIFKEPFKKPFSRKRETTAVVEEPLSRKREMTAMGKEPLESFAPDLVAEVKNNCRIATEAQTGKLRPFQTYVWDASKNEVNKLPMNVREDLTQAYIDMHLANRIVWLSIELGRRSQNLDENYIKLCTSIAARFDRVTRLLERLGD